MSVGTAIVATSVTGGTGALTLSTPASGPFLHAAQFTDYWGTGSPAPWVDYTIEEFTDATLTSWKQVEIGICPLTSGVTLSRNGTNAKVKYTYVQGTGVKPSTPNASAPSAINFGSTAANIRITCSLRADNGFQYPRFRNDTNSGTSTTADLLGWPSAHLGSLNTITLTLVAGQIYYAPFLVARSGNYTKATIFVTAAAGTLARFGLYRMDGTGWCDSLIQDWAAATGGTEFAINGTGLKTSTTTNPLYLSQGWYMGAFQANGTAAITVSHIRWSNPLGTTSGGTIAAATVAGTYGALASTATAASSCTMSAANVDPMVLLQ